MSVLFYRRPDYLNPATGPINQTQCMRYVERAKKSERAIPDGLSFEDVINKKSLPPCSLNDFMDYLVYIEHNAENLQFYLWYQDYERRFNALPEAEKALSKEWVLDNKEIPNLTKDPEKEAVKTKRNTIRSIIGVKSDKEDVEAYDSNGAALFTEDREAAAAEDRHASIFMESASTLAPSTSEVTAVPSTAEVTAQAGLKWQPFTVQPMREEVNRVMRHYLAFTSPRELNLSHKDRAQCLHALQHTTHPSAFKSAVVIAEAALRGQSHPNFIRWSICNGNKPRVFFVRTMGVLHIAFGFIIAIFLVLSRVSRWWRILAGPMFFIGFSTMVAAYKGLCVILHRSHTRNLRPWEQDIDSEMGDTRRNSFSSTAQRDVQMASRTEDYDDVEKVKEASIFRPISFQTFGEKNSFDDAQWVAKYEKKPLLSKVFESQGIFTQDEALRLLQDKIVLGANLWGVILTVVWTIIFVALPKGNLY